MSETVVAQIPKCSRDRSAMDLRCSLNLVVLGRLDRVVPSAARLIGRFSKLTSVSLCIRAKPLVGIRFS